MTSNDLNECDVAGDDSTCEGQSGLTIRFETKSSLTDGTFNFLDEVVGMPSYCYRKFVDDGANYYGRCLSWQAWQSEDVEDGRLKEKQHEAHTREMFVTVLEDEDNFIRLQLEGHATNAIVPQTDWIACQWAVEHLDAYDDPVDCAAGIDWKIEITIDRRSGKEVINVDGSHDGFPAYELDVNGKNIYNFDPYYPGQGFPKQSPLDLLPGIFGENMDVEFSVNCAEGLDTCERSFFNVEF